MTTLLALFPAGWEPNCKCKHGREVVVIYTPDEVESYFSCGAADCRPSRELLSRVQTISFATPEGLKEFSDGLKESGHARLICNDN